MVFRLSRPYEKIFAYPLVPDVSKYDVVVPPPELVEKAPQEVLAEPSPVGRPGWGVAGAPFALYDANSDEFWLTYRTAGGTRGHELHISKSKDGEKFTDVKCFGPNFVCERSALLRDPKTGKFKLYITRLHSFGAGARRPELARPPIGPSPGETWWVIDKLDDVEDPKDFDQQTIRTVLQPSASGMDWYTVKDPYIVVVGNRFYMYYIGRGKYEQCFLATSLDGERWEKHPSNPVLSQGGWHDFYTRPACLVPAGNLYLFYYEGFGKEWLAPVYNIATGLAVTFDLERIIDITPNAPILISPTPGDNGRTRTLRYMDAVLLEDRVLFYYEAARKDGANELRVTEVPLAT